MNKLTELQCVGVDESSHLMERLSDAIEEATISLREVKEGELSFADWLESSSLTALNSGCEDMIEAIESLQETEEDSFESLEDY